MITFPFWIIAGISIIALIIASITDIKKREVPDFLNFSLIGIGLAIGAILSIFNWSIWPLLTSIEGLVAGYLIAALMYYTGQWGGGDAKMLMGLGALHGLAIFGPQSFIIHKTVPLFFTIIITIFIAGSIYSLFYLIGMLIAHWKEYKKALRKKLQEEKIKKQKWIALAIIILSLIGVISFNNKEIQVLISAFGTLVILGLYASIIIKTAEKTLMIKKIPVNKLVEGDWISKDVIVNGKLICGPKTLGVEEKHIKELKKLKIKNVYVKEGVPFIPGFLLGYIMILIFGNWFSVFMITFF